MLGSQTLKPFRIGYEGERIAFYPRMASDAEMEDVQQELNEANGSDDKYQKKFEIYRKAVADWSEKPPQRATKGKVEFHYTDLVENPEGALDAIVRFFDKLTPENEKVIKGAFNTFVNLMTPELDFL